MLSLLVFLATCGAIKAIPAGTLTNSGLGIVNGKTANIQDHPYEVSIERDGNGEFYCAGTVIGKMHVLTSAHCASLVQVNQPQIRSGSSIRGTGGVLHNILSKIIHEEYNPTNGMNNIAIIRVADAFDNNATIAWSQDGSDKVTGSEGIVSGWGNLNLTTATNELHEASMTIIDGNECLGKGVEVKQDAGEFCAEGQGTATCYGDAGAPFVKMVNNERRLVGFLSWRVGNCYGDHPDVFADVSYYKAWINSHTNNN